MDQLVTQWINSFAGRNAAADWLMSAAGRFGIPLLILFVILQWWSSRERLATRHACVAAGLSFVIGLAINQAILLFVHRVRPYDAGLTHLIIDRSADWSFPSDHATASLAIAATFIMSRIWLRGFVLLAGAVLICVSRIYVGTHYASDILGGTATGAIAATCVWLCYWQDTAVDRFITGIL